MRSKARKEATTLGARYFTFDNIPFELVKKGASAKEIKTIAERTEKLAAWLDSLMDSVSCKMGLWTFNGNKANRILVD